MKTVLVFLIVLPIHFARSTTFTNLNFESVRQPLTIVDPLTGGVSAAQAIPGWHVFVGGTEVSTLLYNGKAFGPAWMSLYSRAYDPIFAIEGNYFVQIYSGLVSPLPTGAGVAITQTGLIPPDAVSLQLKTWRAPTPFEISIGGSTLSMTPVFTGSNYVTHAADISAYAGQELELCIGVTYDGIAPGGQTHALLFDDIQFSTEPIPEPPVIALLVFAGAGLYWHLRRRG